MTDLQTILNELKKGYLIKLETELLTLNSMLNTDPINIEELYRKVHTISGTGGVYGLSQISDCSSEFEIYIKEKKDSNLTQKELREELTKYTKLLERLILAGA